MISDPAAAALAMVLALVAVGAYSQRAVLQPNRGAALAYLGGVVTWGAAVAALWAAWAASSEAELCPEASCEALVETIEHSAESSDEVMLSQDWVE